GNRTNTMDRELYSIRKEIKYVVPLGKVLAIRKQLDRLLQRDGHCVNGPYSVRSLYFDSVNNIDYVEKLAGVVDRKKVRLRIYDGDASLCKLEIKQKTDDRQQKMSLLVSESDARELSRGNIKVLRNYFDSSETSRKAYGIMTQGQYRPVAQIEYDRLAYKYPMYDTRITLDMNVRSSESNLDLFSSEVHYTPIMWEDVVLEVKYSGKLMGFLSTMLAQFHLTQGTYSKYCAGRQVYYDFNY
ncbi:MAG: polyphosphate polymerase domain-containing protein, partial [Lachnospiraceae bacterium]|nr:polyphosphate polymerase domain-containing protein [Lachnospiraceae bacterium]